MLHVSRRVTNSSISQWKARSLYQHTWRQEGIRALSITKKCVKLRLDSKPEAEPIEFAGRSPDAAVGLGSVPACKK